MRRPIRPSSASCFFPSTRPILPPCWPLIVRTEKSHSAGRSAPRSPEDTEALLESIGFQYGQAGKEFTHPNMLVFLDPNLRVAKWIYGDQYSGRDIDAALRVAAGESDWIGQHSDVLYALLAFCRIDLLCRLLLLLAATDRPPPGGQTDSSHGAAVRQLAHSAWRSLPAASELSSSLCKKSVRFDH